ncbi:heavy metal translocating P-type ATPase [Pseudonocardia sp. GCM10023141]|uniref:heavy metal translocating P-type ATPase n=1 Tax=Pseudonocardia sp. GCM10023141 TaxID=3252653 RepID=UPI0036245AB8
MTMVQGRPRVVRPARSVWARLWDLTEIRWAAIATGLFALGGVAQLSGAPEPVWWALYLACYVTGGWEPALAGLRALRERTLDVDLLMIVAAVVAAGIGQVVDGALLIVIFATSGALEAFVTRRTADSVRALLDLAPERATRVRRADGEAGSSDDTDAEEEVDTAQLEVGDVVLVRPGERVGADGEVLAGVSELDQASITGEPLPVLKQTGDPVFAGTLNGTGALRVRVTRAAADSVVARIVAMVEQASATKARTQLFIEKVEQRYSIGVVVATLALFGIPLVWGVAFEPTLLRAMTFMIVASPCAVVLATMPPLLSAMANAGRHGLLVKSAVVMEKFREISVVAFDKTGTLTEGTPRVADIRLLPHTGITAGLDAVGLLRLAAAAEHPSEHPLARAILAAAHDRHLALPRASDFGSAPGRGVTATVDGRRIQVGSPVLLDGLAAAAGLAVARAVVAELEDDGATAVVILIDEVPAGVLGLVDRLRPDAAATVTALTALTGATPVLLTGDNPGAAARLAAEVGITEVRAGLLPADKVTHVLALQGDGHRVLLVGEGVNDAPAMAAAYLGVAMGRHGSDLALDTSDAVIVRDELAILPKIIDLSARAHRVMRANLALAATVITALVVWDLTAVLPLPLGVAGHEGSTVLVGLNGLRLLRKAAWRGAGADRSDPAVTAELPERERVGLSR